MIYNETNLPKNEVMKGEIIDFEDSRGDYALVSVRNKEMRLFFPEYSKYGWNELDNKGKLGTLKGEKIKFYLSLFSLPDDIKKIKNQKKGYTLIERATYLLEGSIAEKITAKDLAILDCKMPVYVHLENKRDLNKGDWIEAKGRLDAYLIESKKG